jgi:hypothetical protein
VFPENGENEGGIDSEYHFGEIQVNATSQQKIKLICCQNNIKKV